MKSTIFILIAAISNIALAQAQVQLKQIAILGGPPTGKEIELGRKLFFDPRLSVDGSVACASCHAPSLGFSDGRRVALGVRDLVGNRNSPTIVNSCYSPSMFWDGRTIGMNTQALLPLVNPVEMANRSEQDVIRRLQAITGYLVLFAETFGPDLSSGNPINAPRLARAMAAFQSTLISFDAPVDRFLAGNPDAMTADAKIGFEIFKSANCMACHVPPLYTDYKLHNNGMEFASKSRITDNGRYDDLRSKNLATSAADVRAFKTPTLRNVKLSGPYNHAGTYDTLRRCVIHYNVGGANNRGYRDRYIDQRIRSLKLTDTQVDYLVRFLEEGLTSIDYPLIDEPVLP